MTPQEFVSLNHGVRYTTVHKEADGVEWGNLLPRVDCLGRIIGLVDSQGDDPWLALDLYVVDGEYQLVPFEDDLGMPPVAETVAAWKS